VAIKISDEAGGIARSKLADVWSYLHGGSSPWRGGGVGAAEAAGGEEPSQLGLPLSRLYAKYFGGTLHMTPMEGYGTDCYARFNRLAHESAETVVQAHEMPTTNALNNGGVGQGLFDVQSRRS